MGAFAVRRCLGARRWRAARLAGRHRLSRPLPGPAFDADDDVLALSVNGVPVFARGAVWTPVVEDEVVARRYATLRDAGMNMVRIPGIGVPRDRCLPRCVRQVGVAGLAGLHVRQPRLPDRGRGFRATVEAEARAAARAGRRAAEPGGAVRQQRGRAAGGDVRGRGGWARSRPWRAVRRAAAGSWRARPAPMSPYVPSAPCGGAMPFRPGDGRRQLLRRRRLPAAARATCAGRGVRFASECLAFANLPDGVVADGEGVARDVGADWDFADVRDHYLTRDVRVGGPGRAARRRPGALPRPRSPGHRRGHGLRLRRMAPGRLGLRRRDRPVGARPRAGRRLGAARPWWRARR